MLLNGKYIYKVDVAYLSHEITDTNVRQETAHATR